MRLKIEQKTNLKNFKKFLKKVLTISKKSAKYMAINNIKIVYLFKKF